MAGHAGIGACEVLESRFKADGTGCGPVRGRARDLPYLIRGPSQARRPGRLILDGLIADADQELHLRGHVGDCARELIPEHGVCVGNGRESDHGQLRLAVGGIHASDFVGNVFDEFDDGQGHEGPDGCMGRVERTAEVLHARRGLGRLILEIVEGPARLRRGLGDVLFSF